MPFTRKARHTTVSYPEFTGDEFTTIAHIGGAVKRMPFSLVTMSGASVYITIRSVDDVRKYSSRIEKALKTHKRLRVKGGIKK